MFSLFNSKKSIFTGTNFREFLKKNGVKYKYKVNSQTGRWAGGGSHRGIHGSIGIDSSHDKLYEIFIKAKDAKRLGL